MNTKEIQKFVRSIVIRFLKVRPHLEPYRLDLEQEGAMALLKYEASWRPNMGTSKNEWLYYTVRNSLLKYIDRREKRHFRKPEGITDLQEQELDTLKSQGDLTEEDTARLQYLEDLWYRTHGEAWDLQEVADPMDFPTEDQSYAEKRELYDALFGVPLTPREQEFLSEYCRLGTLDKASEAMGISKQRASQLFAQIVRKAQEANDLS